MDNYQSVKQNFIKFFQIIFIKIEKLKIPKLK